MPEGSGTELGSAAYDAGDESLLHEERCQHARGAGLRVAAVQKCRGLCAGVEERRPRVLQWPALRGRGDLPRRADSLDIFYCAGIGGEKQ